jgi:uncharacterized protein YjiS (DUF1127 family)
MDTISSAAARPSASGGLRGFIRWIGICADRLDAYLARRDGIKALREMDDRQLRDIGLARCHIEAAVCDGTRSWGGFDDDAKHIRRHRGL